MTRRRVAVVGLALGIVVGVRPSDAQSPGTLRGIVIDSLTGLPLADAAVQIALATDVARARTMVADSLGRFRFDALPPGRWIAGFVHPAAEALPAEALARLVDVVAGDTTIVALGLPGPKRVRAMLCPSRVGDSTAALFGVVRDADTGAPLDSATLTLAWRELAFDAPGGGMRIAQRRAPIAVQGGGTYVACGVPADAELSLHGDAPGRASGDVDVAVVAWGAAHVDVTVGADALRGPRGHARGAAKLVGIVVDEFGRPVPNARVAVVGSDAVATTIDAGTFALDGLPSGTWTVEARAIGFAPARGTVSLARDRPASARLVAERYVAALDRVVVKATRDPASAVLAAFRDRRAHGAGSFLGPDELARRSVVYASELLDGVAGIAVRAKPRGFGSVVRERSGCAPNVFVDGTAVEHGADDLDELLMPSNVLAIEIYRGPEAPARFSGRSADGCGAIVIWTRR